MVKNLKFCCFDDKSKPFLILEITHDEKDKMERNYQHFLHDSGNRENGRNKQSLSLFSPRWQ